MSITISQRQTVNYNEAGADGKPKSDKYLDFIDDTTGDAAATLNIPANGTPPFFAVDGTPLVIYSATVTLTDAQIKAWPNTGIQIVEGQGAGTVIFPHSFFMSITSVAAYVGLDAAASLVVRWGANRIVSLNTAGDKTNLSNILTSGDGEIWLKAPLTGDVSQVGLTEADNLPLTLYLDSPDPLTGGDAANRLTMTFNYSIATV